MLHCDLRNIRGNGIWTHSLYTSPRNGGGLIADNHFVSVARDAIQVGHATQVECDELGMSAAQKLAAARALDGLGVVAHRVVLDGNWDFVGRGTTMKLVKGDARCLSIAAASILAKVTRDRIMRAEAENYPGYDFELNKGDPCPRHKVALRGYGPSAIHRRSWVFMDNLPWTGIPRIFPAGLQEVLF